MLRPSQIGRGVQSLVGCLARSPAVALLFDEECDQGNDHDDNTNERQNSRGTKYAEEKEKTADKHE